MGLIDTIKDNLGRQRSERRIQFRTKTSEAVQKHPDPDGELESYLQHYTDKVYHYGSRAWGETQVRKKQGKQTLIAWTKQGIGMTARTVLGPRKNPTPSKTIKIANPTIKIKIKKQRRK